jgi:hypothetical protein
MWPLSLPDPLYKIISGTILLGLCLSQLRAQTTSPLTTPPQVDYPGIIQTFEKLIQIDHDKFTKRADELFKNSKTFQDASLVNNLDLEPAFLNSIILHSDPGYIRLASSDKCRFYDTIITDLLRSDEGKIKNVFITFLSKDNVRESAIVSKRDFLNKVVNRECPETQKLIDQFQVKNVSETLKATNFEIPTGKDQCQNIHLGWINNPKTPYLCQIQEFILEAKKNGGDPKDLIQRKAVSKILEQKLSVVQKDYLENLCAHLDDEKLFCEEFLNVSFWNKVAAGYEDKIYAEGICEKILGVSPLNDNQLKGCLIRMKKESDLCLYQRGSKSALAPQMECEALSLALNYSGLRSNYQDCPASSDELGVTNMSRILLNISQAPIKQFSGPCSSVSAGEVLNFNTRFDNDESWSLEACYQDRINEKEVCAKTFFGNYDNNPASYTNVVANILKATRGAEASTKCDMISSKVYNPILLQYQSGCHIVFEDQKCFISDCQHKVMYNNREVDLIKMKNKLLINYFPNSIREEKFSQHYLLTRDYKQNGRPLNNLSGIETFFKKSKKGIIHGVGCAEDILPSFFKSRGMNQCTPVPFIVDGVIRQDDRATLVTRTALDSLQAPRLISWSNIFSTVKNYQRQHPLKIWTLYGLD